MNTASLTLARGIMYSRSSGYGESWPTPGDANLNPVDSPGGHALLEMVLARLESVRPLTCLLWKGLPAHEVYVDTSMRLLW